ncbi:triose-phosphate isomerase [Canibacter oris]|uniref:Triosephosphate isomerase n=1 Tax=Canibacter oris TaxID=1365628 RepID=A0A840DMT7_9MICO|nr:triose-phosphate isomerase [Canibacter oris]MBB4070869.1 triosephosphate isomerase [Canibacter oris]
MTTQRKPLIAGNWKMNYDHLQAIAFVQKLAWLLADAKYDASAVEVAVFPPFTDLRSVQTLLMAEKINLALGAQDVSAQSQGAFTGDIAADFLEKLNVSYVIVGHSERRAGHHETDQLIGQKAAAAAAKHLVPVICVGETAADLEEHGAAAVPVRQLAGALAELPENAEFVIAYEPVWAIGSGQAATAQQAQQVAKALREELERLRGVECAAATRILYGGSVNSENIAGFMAQPDVDGALVGGASLKAEEFTKIIQFPQHITV